MCPAKNIGPTAVAFWVGLDGYSDKTVEQTGVVADCYWDSATRKYQAEYNAWYQMAPDRQVYTGDGFGRLKPKPGTIVTATVTFDTADKDRYRLTLTVTGDGATPETASAVQRCPEGSSCENRSAEWVAETVPEAKPSTKLVRLAAFSPWVLTSGHAVLRTSSGQKTVASLDPVRLVMRKRGGKSNLAYPCNLSDDSFVVQRSRC
jgi:hypothetical protein